MNRLSIFNIAGSLALMFALSSCLKDKNFPDEPVIEFKVLNTYGADSARLVLKFTDGDGNMGLEDSDTAPPFCTTCEYHHNLFCEYYEKQNGVWTHIPLDPDLGQIPFWYRVPWLKPSGQNQSQQGEISIAMPFYYLTGTGFDTARFEIYVVDRALNKSNTVVTSAFRKP